MFVTFFVSKLYIVYILKIVSVHAKVPNCFKTVEHTNYTTIPLHDETRCFYSGRGTMGDDTTKFMGNAEQIFTDGSKLKSEVSVDICSKAFLN